VGPTRWIEERKGMAIPIRHTLDQIIVLEAIVRTGTFAAAAKELHRVPSAISYTIRGLEEALNVQIFDRRGQRAELTAAGRKILNESASLLLEARKLEKIAAQISGGWEPVLQIVVDGILPISRVTRSLRVFAEREIPTKIRLDIEYQEGVPDRFFNDRADIMIILDFEDDSNSLDSLELPDLEMVMAVSESHPLAALESVGRETLHQYFELVVKDSSPKFSKKPKKVFMGSQNVVYLSDFYSKRMAIIDGVGFGWIPLHLITQQLTEGSICLVDYEHSNKWTYHPKIVTRRGEPIGRAGQLFIQSLLGNEI
jgi:DNA-binding transcriptional LysR family regulator